jgi:hypothetical protein
MGFSYDEIADVLDVSHTRVNQLITEANMAMRREHLRIAPDQQPRSPRSNRCALAEMSFNRRERLWTARDHTAPVLTA